ncbi:MAG: hypothetical protein AB1505_19990 [Candidatus Latescibacterota bacterium]
MYVTRQVVAEQLRAYLRGDLRLEEMVAWAKEVMAEGALPEEDLSVVRDVVARLGVSDVPAFALTWEDLRQMLARLGYRAQVELEATV